MEGLYSWGIAVIRGIQHFETPVLTGIMRAVTTAGSEYAYLALLPLVYWCVDERRGFRLALGLLFSAWVNGFVKMALKQPRPYQLDPSVGRVTENSYGIPSGHAQISTTFWGMVALGVRRPWALAVAILAPLVIGFSRIYLGAHFPTDVFAGWILGALLVGLYGLLGSQLEGLLRGLNVRFIVLIVALGAYGMNALNPQDTTMGGLFLGMALGYLAMDRRFPFRANRGADGGKALLGQLVLRYAVGMAGTVVVYALLKRWFPSQGKPWFPFFHFLRYALVGFWVTAGAPWVFLKTRLAPRREV